MSTDGPAIVRALVVGGAFSAGVLMSRGSTTERGYGWGHQRARSRAIRDLRDGDPCTRCGQAMYRAEAKGLDLDHTPDRGGYQGLAHATCNRRAGQAVAVANRAATKTVINSRAW